MMTYIGCEEGGGAKGRDEQERGSEREREKPVGGWERFLPHIKVFTWLCMCLCSGRGRRKRRRSKTFAVRRPVL